MEIKLKLDSYCKPNAGELHFIVTHVKYCDLPFYHMSSKNQELVTSLVGFGLYVGILQ